MTTDPPPYDEIVALARRAPSFHNTQPWLWRDAGEHLDLLSDESRRLPHSDPDGRSLMLSCGAVLHHLQVAAAGLAWSATVDRLPEPGDPRLLGRVRLRPGVTSPEESVLLHCLTRRHSDRRPFAPGEVRAAELRELVCVGERWGSLVLPVHDRRQRRLLRRLAVEADQLQREDAAIVDELAAWTGFRRDDGVRASSVPDRATVGAGFPNRFRAGRLRSVDGLDDGQEDVPSWQTAPALLLVTTSSDDRLSWLRAGEALSAIWLEATRQGLCLVPVNQCLEVAATREQVTAAVLRGRLCPQVLVIAGRPPSGRPALPRTPRRPVEDVMVRA